MARLNIRFDKLFHLELLLMPTVTAHWFFQRLWLWWLNHYH